MIVEERMRTYINSLDMGNTDFLESLGKGGSVIRSSHYPERDAELYKGASGCKKAGAYSWRWGQP